MATTASARGRIHAALAGLVALLVVAGCGSSSSSSTPSTRSTPATAATSPASVQSCIQKAGFTVSVKPVDSTDRSLGEATKMEVTNSSTLHTVDFWKTAADATYFANNGGGGYRAFGTITIDDANSASAKTIESCFHSTTATAPPTTAPSTTAPSTTTTSTTTPSTTTPSKGFTAVGTITGLALVNGQFSGVNVTLTTGEHVTATVAHAMTITVGHTAELKKVNGKWVVTKVL